LHFEFESKKNLKNRRSPATPNPDHAHPVAPPGHRQSAIFMRNCAGDDDELELDCQMPKAGPAGSLAN
jgi:hypothetical protein